MKVLKGILSESKEFYLDSKDKIEKRLRNLPKGSIKERKISGRKYYYLQERMGKRIVHKYLGKKEPEELLREIHEREFLKDELKKVNAALRMLKRTEGRRP